MAQGWLDYLTPPLDEEYFLLYATVVVWLTVIIAGFGVAPPPHSSLGSSTVVRPLPDRCSTATRPLLDRYSDGCATPHACSPSPTHVPLLRPCSVLAHDMLRLAALRALIACVTHAAR